MAETRIIPIHCDHQRRLEYLTLAELEEFQEDLVELSDEGYNHLRDSILKHGIIAPIFYWLNPDDPAHTPKILDGHQRKKVCVQEDWKLDGGKWPVVDIQAPTEQAAAEILLQLRGQHGTVTEQGLYDFITGKDIDVDRLLDFDLPGFDLESFKDVFVAIEGELPQLPDGEKPPFQQMTFTLHDSQVEAITHALRIAKAQTDFADSPNENSNGNALAFICETFGAHHGIS